MKALVVDASIAIKWVIQEKGTKQALSLLRHRLCAPDLLVAECANVLWKKVRRCELSAREASLAARLLERTDIELLPTRRHLEAATALAIELDHPAHDCIYLALGMAAGSDLITADERLCEKLRNRKLPIRILSLTNVHEALRPGGA